MKKKDSIIKGIVNSVLPVILAFAFGAIIIAAIGESPLETYGVLIRKSLLTEKGFMNTLHYASPLILTGLAIAITFKANLYNMGVEGQMLLGGFFAGITGAYLNISNPFISKLICFLVAIVCGMLFALIPAILKAKCNVNEMVVTLMLNYAVSKTLEFLTTGVFKDKSAGYVATPTIKENVMFKRFGASRMTMFFVIAMIILAFGVGKGIEKVNKVLMPVFFILFVVLGIYVAFQPGAADGYRYIFRVEPEVLAKPSTWIFALGQAFFSLSVAGNGTLIYGSYLPDSEDIPASAARVALFDTLAAMLAALVIIPAMATTGAQLDQGGPGLLFIYLPHLIKTMPGGRIIAIIFFVAVFLAGMTSLMNLYEAPIATVQEKTGLGRIPSCMVIAAIGVVVSLLIQGIVSDWMDVLSIYICPLGAGLAGIMFFWVFGRNYVESQINKGREKPFTKYFYPVCKYLYIPVCFLVLILGIVLGGIG